MLALGVKAGLGITFVDALDATLPGAAPVLATMRATGPTGNLGLGALACTQSHARAWRALLDSGAEFGLILEDDVILSADFTSVISALIAAKPNFDLIKLEDGGSAKDGLVLGPVLGSYGGRSLRACYQLATDSAGYIISRKGAAQALDRIAACNLGVDHFLFHPLNLPNTAGLRFALIVPPVVTQDRADPSDIIRSRYTGAAWRRKARWLFYELRPAGTMLRALLLRGARVIKVPFQP